MQNCTRPISAVLLIVSVTPNLRRIGNYMKVMRRIPDMIPYMKKKVILHRAATKELSATKYNSGWSSMVAFSQNEA